MAMVTHDGKNILVSATGRDRFLIVDLATGKIEHTVKTGKSPEHFDLAPDGRLAFVGNIEDSTVSVIDWPRHAPEDRHQSGAGDGGDDGG
jgi:DNA-binding beta-propeller fold protein YncE